MLKIIIAFILFLNLITPANADNIFRDEPVAHKEYFVDATVTSVHFSSKNYNSNNLGFGLSARWNQFFEGRIGYYKNSYYRQSEYLLVNVIPHSFETENWGVDTGFGFGAVTGYKGTAGEKGIMVGDAMLMVVPNLTVTYRPLGVRSSIVIAGNALALQVGYNFK